MFDHGLPIFLHECPRPGDLLFRRLARQVRLRGAAAILTGRLFDDRGNRMSPTHANKLGVRYRYYVSQAILQNRKVEAGSIARVPAPEVETLVCEGIRRHLAAKGDGEPADR